MRGTSRLVLLLAVVVVGLVGAGRAGSMALTQHGTPAPDGDAPPVEAGPDPRVMYEPFASGPVPALPAAPEELVLIRLRLKPGGTFALDPSDPGATLYVVQAGTLTAHLTAPVRVRRVGEITPEERAAAVATVDPGAPLEEAVAAGAAVAVGPDDSFVVPPWTGGELRNEGSEPVVVLAGTIVPGAAGTPTP
jgi:hypothetical protein